MDEVPNIIEHYHHLRHKGDVAGARASLALAMQVPGYRAEAQLWQGMEALQAGDYPSAFLQFAQAAQALPKRADISALMGRAAMGQQKPQLAAKLLEAAWRKDPKHPALRIALWQARLASQPAATSVQQLHTALEHIEDAGELRFVLTQLAQLSPQGSVAGSVQYHAPEGAITGWAVNLHAPQTPARLHMAVGQRQMDFAANQPHPLLLQAGWPAHAGFRIQLQPQREPVHVRAGSMPDATALDRVALDRVAPDLTGSPLAIAPILPGVPGHAFKKVGEPQANAAPQSSSTIQTNTPGKSVKQGGKTQANLHTVDVLIPVYEGYDETLACINSVLQYRQANRTPHHVVVLNDASPNAGLTQALSQLAQAGRITHIQRPVNLGFIRNVNRGMALHPDRDVVWLNADTQVHGNWLDRLRAAAYANTQTASATPFSNNGELLSFPQSRVCHPMPTSQALAQLDVLAAKQPATPVPIETGCGFCLFIKRGALDEVGYLDEIQLLRGYGEETDWCLRARDKGWQHVAAPNVFVAHQGGVSFKDEKILRVKHNNDILRQRYPGAEARFDAISQQDPLEPARQKLQRARLALVPAWMQNPPQEEDMQKNTENPRTLYITGGLREQAGLPAIEAPLRLAFYSRGQTAGACLHIQAGALPLSVEYKLPGDEKLLLKDLKKLPIDNIVFTQTLGCPEDLLQLPDTLGVPHVVRSLPANGVDASPALKRLLTTAQAIQVPYNALVLAYRKAMPDANITALPATPLATPSPIPEAMHSVMVADALQHSAAATHWLAVARKLAQHKQSYGYAPILLIPGNTPWQEQLLTTGVAARLQDVEGTSRQETLALAGCSVAISLDNCPDASWLAPALANSAGLPLYAPLSAVARQAGAQALTELSAVAPWLTTA